MKDKYNAAEVAELFGVDNNTLKLWRSPQRLKGGEDNPLYLPVQTDPANKNVVWYSHNDLLEFIRRNEKYREHVLASFAPAQIREQFQPALPRAVATTWAEELRAIAPHTSLTPIPQGESA